MQKRILTIRVRTRIATENIHASVRFSPRRRAQTPAPDGAQVEKGDDVSYRYHRGETDAAVNVSGGAA
jgi:hypothetical protein